MNLLEELEWRGLIADCTDRSELAKRLETGPLTLYCGFDPTADSLHVGNLVPLLGLRRFQLAGHRPIAVAGGATGRVGDPSGRTAERQLLAADALATNLAAIKNQMRRFLDFETPVNPARLVDNADWTTPVSCLDFLRDIGKHISVNMMLAKESVRARMEDRETGISFTEFSYMLLQAFDFYVLARDLDCELQVGGSDQWGNITTGIDLTRKKIGRTVYGLTFPLITNADGSKFGKSVSGSVWLDRRKTSVYRFYQFWIRTDDRDVIRYLKFFTFMSRDDIDALTHEHEAKPEGRVAHKALAHAMTTMVHDATATTEAMRASEILFGGELDGVSEDTFQEIVGEVPTQATPRTRFEGDGTPLVDVLAETGLCASKGQARKDIQGGGIYVNNRRAGEAQQMLRSSDLLFGKHLLLRKGKRNYLVVTATS